MDIDEPETSSGHGRRPGPVRTFSNRAGRAAPYRRPQPQAAPPRGDPDAPWQHDLFDTSSNLYSPKVSASWNLRGSAAAAAERSKPSPSLRPFGSLTLPSESSTAASQGLAERMSFSGGASSEFSANPLAGRLGLPLAARLGLPSASANPSTASSLPPSATQATKRTVEPVRQHIQPAPKPAQRAPRRKERPAPATQERQGQSQQQQQQQEGGPVTVIVANLAEGTTAEDVKTAFSDFGVILSCSVRDLDNSSLEAQVVFSTKDDAERAVTRLNGAVADNRVLNVSISERFRPSTEGSLQTGKPQVTELINKAPRGPRSMQQSRPARISQPKRPAPTQTAAFVATSSGLAARLGLSISTPSVVHSHAPQPARPASANAQRAGPTQANDLIPASDQLLNLDPRASVVTEPPKIANQSVKREDLRRRVSQPAVRTGKLQSRIMMDIS